MALTISSLLNRERERIKIILLSTFFWGLLAHGYALLNFTISHDSLNEFYMFQPIIYYSGNTAQWKIALGRFLAPVYHMLFRGETIAPWFSGMLALFWIALAAWVTSLIFEIRSRSLLIVTSGIFTVNLSVIAFTATYLSDLDANMFAVLAAVLAVFFWKAGGKRSLLSIPALIVSLGLYQSILSVYISFVMFVCILWLLDGQDVKSVFLSGLKAVGLMLAAGILYFACALAACKLCGITLTQQENGMANMFQGDVNPLLLLYLTYQSWVDLYLYTPPKLNLLFQVPLFLSAVWVVLTRLRSKQITLPGKLLVIALGLLLPFGMNVAAFLNRGIVHLLMLLAGWFLYLLALLLCRNSRLNAVSLALVCLILFSNARFANTLYTRKDIERQSTLSLMTRVADRLEQEDGYIPGVTPVAILGIPKSAELPGFRRTYDFVGAYATSPITSDNYYDAYFCYVLQEPILLCDAERRSELAVQAEDLPAFPSKDCITWIDDVLVLKVN